MKRHSFSIYDASAGSGKTYALVKEYFKIILTAAKNDAYRNILAITFTNKAVHEMKSRIVGNLSEFALDLPSHKAQQLMAELISETGMSDNEIKSKSKSIIKHIIHNYAAFDILTIDKFTHKVIRAFAHDLNLPMTFEVTLDTENLLIEAVDAIIGQAGSDEILTKLLLTFTIEKIDDDKSWDISREILETGRLVLNENHRNKILDFQKKTIAEFVEIKERLVECCKILEKECVSTAISALTLIESNGIDSKSFSSEHFPNHLGYVQAGALKSTHKRYLTFEDIKINKAAKDRTLIESIVPELLISLSCVYKNYEQRDFYKAFLKNITPLSLLNTVSNELRKIQTEQNVLSIAEFNSIIYREIQNQPAPFIYERLGERYRHFFIDEFQDTSEMQWQNLIPLIDNSLSGQDEAGEKGTLMIVGDPKQSIYRWRGGKAEQFIELGKDKNPFNTQDKKIEHLDKNYRSYSQIIEFNNMFFRFLAGEFDNLNYKDLYANHSRQKINNKLGGYVNISFIPSAEVWENDEDAHDKTQLYLKATLATIQNVKRQGFLYSEIVILTRKRNEGIAIANYLTKQVVPLFSSETLMLQNSAEVKLIINLLRYLKNSGNTEAKAHFLHYMANAVQSELPVHDFIAQGMEQRQEAGFEQWLLRFSFYNAAAISFQDIRKKSLYESVEFIILKFIGPNGQNAYVQYFLDIVLERDVRNQAGIADFLDYWEKHGDKFSIPSPEGKDAVQIMTIHKSKGLEFPVVIMPFAEEDYGRKPKDKLWIDADESDFGLPKVLIDNSSAVEGFGAAVAEVYNQKKQEELLDNVNVLYVALTRAEEQLYVISNMNLTAKGEVRGNTMSNFFIDYLKYEGVFDTNQFEYEFGKAQKLSSGIESNEETNEISTALEILDPKNIKIAQRESVMWGTPQQNAIEYGNVVHEILSFVKAKNDIDLALIKAVESGLIKVSQREAVRITIEKIVNHKELQFYFVEGNEVLNEQDIVQKVGKILKPDRMVLVKYKEIFLLEYKTGGQLPKHQQQLEGYKRAIELMGYKVLQSALVYIGEQVEVVCQ